MTDKRLLRQMQNYLTWLQERGQRWPLVSSLRKRREAGEQEQELLPRASGSLFTQAGSLEAEYLAVTECIAGQKIVFGAERELLIKMMQALGIDLKSNFCLLGLNTAATCAPLAAMTAYRQDFAKTVARLRPRAIFAFGPLATDLLPADEAGDTALAFDERVACWQNYLCGGEVYPFLPLPHLQSLLRTPSLKPRAWQALQQIKEAAQKIP